MGVVEGEKSEGAWAGWRQSMQKGQSFQEETQ